MEEDPSTSWVVRRIFDEAANGNGQAKIAAGLTRDGIPTPTGKGSVWGQTTARCILKNPCYAGRAAAFRVRVSTECNDDVEAGTMRRVVTTLSETEWIALPDGVVPQLVDQSVFAAVQERFRLNLEQALRSTREPELVLLRGGHVKCGYCGHNMFVHRNRTRVSYRCIRKQRFNDCPGATHVAGPLDDGAWSRVEALLLNPSVIAAELQALEQQDPTANDLSSIDKGMEQVRSRRKNLLGQLGLLDPDSAEEVREMLAATSQRIRDLEVARTAVLGQREARRQGRERLAQLESWCRTVADNIKDLTYDQKRLALDALGVRVTVWRRDDRAPRIEANIPLGVTANTTSGSTSYEQHQINPTLMLRWTDRAASRLLRVHVP